MSELLSVSVTDFELGLLSFPALLILIAFRIPLAAAMFIVGLVGAYMLSGNMRMIDSQLKTFTYGTLTSYSLSIIPLFLLMSEFATRGGMSSGLFKAAEAWLGQDLSGLDLPNYADTGEPA